MPRNAPSPDFLSDQAVFADKEDSFSKYPGVLRRVRYRDPEDGDVYVFLSNNFDLPATTISSLYMARWQVVMFFKWIKQLLRIKAFFGHNLNPMKSQVWIAVSVFVLVANIQQLYAYSEYLLKSNNIPNQLLFYIVYTTSALHVRVKMVVSAL